MASSTWRDQINGKIVSCQGVLDLSGSNLTDAQLIVVASLLQANRVPLRSLTLSNNQIGDGGVRALLAALQTSSQASLEQLTLDQNQLTAAAAAQLGSWLAANKSLMLLNVGSNALGDAGVAALAEGARAHPSLATLLLHRVQCSDQCLPVLLGALVAPATSPLRTLALFGNRLTDLGAAQIAAVLGSATAPLRHALLNGNMITDGGARALANALRTNRQLVSLSLHGQQTSGIGASGLLSLALALLVNSRLSSLDGDERWPESRLTDSSAADAPWLEFNAALQARDVSSAVPLVVTVATTSAVKQTSASAPESHDVSVALRAERECVAALQSQLRVREEKESLLCQNYEARIRMLEVEMQIELQEQLAAAGLGADTPKASAVLMSVPPSVADASRAAASGSATTETTVDAISTQEQATFLLKSSSSTVLLKAPPAVVSHAQSAAVPPASVGAAATTGVGLTPPRYVAAADAVELKRAQAVQLERIKKAGGMSKQEIMAKAKAAASTQSRSGVLSSSSAAAAAAAVDDADTSSASAVNAATSAAGSFAAAVAPASAATRAALMQAEMARKRAEATKS